MHQRLSKLVFFALLLLAIPANAQTGWMPEKTNKLVNDYSNILTNQQREEMEQRLEAFSDSTSNQILILITPTLGGDEENALAQRIGQTWGVGQKGFDNGVVILVKTKTPEENFGAVAIAVGYGLEGVLPDLACKHIINDTMIPFMREGDYYQALTKALNLIQPLACGEFSYKDYRAQGGDEGDGFIGLGILVGAIGLMWYYIHRYNKKHPNQGGGKGGGYSGGGGGIFLGGLGSSHSSHGGGHHSGGFGGFGGGSFGGGGASGRF
jgi:uncharacterized protein